MSASLNFPLDLSLWIKAYAKAKLEIRVRNRILASPNKIKCFEPINSMSYAPNTKLRLDEIKASPNS
jgi:hypothetical protein